IVITWQVCARRSQGSRSKRTTRQPFVPPHGPGKAAPSGQPCSVAQPRESREEREGTTDAFLRVLPVLRQLHSNSVENLEPANRLLTQGPGESLFPGQSERRPALLREEVDNASAYSFAGRAWPGDGP